MVIKVEINGGKRRLMTQATIETNLRGRVEWVRRAGSGGSIEAVVWKILEARTRLRLIDGWLRWKNRETGWTRTCGRNTVGEWRYAIKFKFLRWWDDWRWIPACTKRSSSSGGQGWRAVRFVIFGCGIRVWGSKRVIHRRSRVSVCWPRCQSWRCSRRKITSRRRSKLGRHCKASERRYWAWKEEAGRREGEEGRRGFYRARQVTGAFPEEARRWINHPLFALDRQGSFRIALLHSAGSDYLERTVLLTSKAVTMR